MGPEDGISDCEAKCSSYKKSSVVAEESDILIASVGSGHNDEKCPQRMHLDFGSRDIKLVICTGGKLYVL